MRYKALFVTAFVAGLATGPGNVAAAQSSLDGTWVMGDSEQRIPLPAPRLKGLTSVEEALARRRSVREYSLSPLGLSELSQLLWSAQGVTDRDGHRTAPSAGALYPLELYVVVGRVDGLSSGVYKYHPADHHLTRIFSGDRRFDLYEFALQQESVRDAPVTLVFSAVYERTTRKYGERGNRYVHMEVGHAAQNVYLQAESLNVKAVVIGAFEDDRVKKLLQMPRAEQPIYLMPLGVSGGSQ